MIEVCCAFLFDGGVLEVVNNITQKLDEKNNNKNENDKTKYCNQLIHTHTHTKDKFVPLLFSLAAFHVVVAVVVVVGLRNYFHQHLTIRMSNSHLV